MAEENKYYRQLKYETPKGKTVKIEWNGRNGALEREVIFDGFIGDRPRLLLPGGAWLDINQIGGYDKIVSLQPVAE
jgi:hypothetical protein